MAKFFKKKKNADSMRQQLAEFNVLSSASEAAKLQCIQQTRDHWNNGIPRYKIIQKFHENYYVCSYLSIKSLVGSLRAIIPRKFVLPADIESSTNRRRRRSQNIGKNSKYKWELVLLKARGVLDWCRCRIISNSTSDSRKCS